MKRTMLTLALLLAPASIWGQTRFIQGVNCTPQGGNFTTAAGRGCLMFEASLTAFTDLRDELTAEMPDAGGGNVTMTCSQCSVDKGITGCAAVGNQVVLTRNRAAVHRLACIMTSIRAQKLLREAHAAADQTDTKGDIGNGNPQ